MEKSNVSIIDVNEAKKEILNGNLVSFPTETVYGLGANVENDKAVLKIYTAKGRPLSNPVIAHVNSINMASKYLKDPPNDIMKLMMNKFWPGPLTIVSDANMSIVPLIVTANTKTIGIRCPDHPIALDLITKCNVGIAAPSANISGHVSPTLSQHVIDDFNSNSIPVKVIHNIYYKCKQNIFSGIESTIIRVEDSKIFVYRLGAISLSNIKEILTENNYHSVEIEIINNHVKKEKEEIKDQVSPGQFLRHYSPNIPTKIISNSGLTKLNLDNIDKCIIIDYGGYLQNLNTKVLKYFDLSQTKNLHEASLHLFNILRMSEKIVNGKEILITDVRIYNQDNCDALYDRIYRASEGNIICL